MTHKEALAEKKEAVLELAENHRDATIIIVPELKEDREKFFEFYDEDTYTDYECKLFSTNDQYIVLITM